MKLADLLGKKVEKKKEKEVLMDYQKTRNYRVKGRRWRKERRKKGKLVRRGTWKSVRTN